MSTDQKFKHVNDLWDDAKADAMDPVERLVYRSNILGADQRITNTGGGNTSSKISQTDPLTGQDTDVLWVKGSGGDLRTSKKENFSSLYQDKLIALQTIYAQADENGVKTPIEDAMVDMYRHCTFNLNPRPSSIDTPLHSFIPHAHVDHMHPNAAISVAASKNAEQLTKDIYGDEVVWIKWQRPGFDLGLVMEQVCKDYPNAKGMIMGQHGLINWAADDKECYKLTLRLIEKAAQYIEDKDNGDKTFGGQKYQSLEEAQRKSILCDILPWLRGQVGAEKRMVGTVQSDDTTLCFINSVDAPRLAEMGTSCPDHFLRTKIKPLFVDWDPATGDVEALREKIATGLDAYRADYADYYNTCKIEGSPAMRDPNPTVILIPGLGLIAWGKNKSESRVTAEFYNCAIEVMRGAEAMDEYIKLPQQEAFDIEYWALEEAKLQRMPKERELARKIVCVVGAGSGIGKECARRLAKEGAHVVCADRGAETAEETAKEIENMLGQGIGVAGTGISGCGPALAQACDMTNRESIQAMTNEIIYAYGGIDQMVVTAGIFVPPDGTGHIPDHMWGVTFDVNVTGSYLIADEMKAIWDAQGLSGHMVVTTSVNGMVSKKGSLAYDTSKAAANHLVRELAMELAPMVRVNAVAPATVVAGSGMFPRDRVISSLIKYSIEFSEDEDTEALRDKLAGFYAERTLTKVAIRPENQVDGILFFLTDMSSKTTGHVLPVDGGLHEAFLR